MPSERENICCKEINKNNIAWHIGILTVKYLHMHAGAYPGFFKGGCLKVSLNHSAGSKKLMSGGGRGACHFVSIMDIGIGRTIRASPYIRVASMSPP